MILDMKNLKKEKKSNDKQNKFVISNKQTINDNLVEKHINEQ
jgi:hypothetical protein